MAKNKRRSADKGWWTLWPELLEDELAASERLGVALRTVHKGNGILIFEADWPVQGRSELMRLRIGFSPLHPFFRPAVAAPDATLERHQNPMSKELCLLTQETGQWNSNQLVVDFIQERLDQLLRTLVARKDGRWDDAAKLEEQSADPLMPYFAGAGAEDSVILFDGKMALPHDRHGLMEVVCTARTGSRNSAAFEGVLRQLKNSRGMMIGKRFGFPIDQPNPPLITGRWVKFTPPPVADAEELLRHAEEELAQHAVMEPESVQKINQAVSGPFSITGIVFPEEVEYGPDKNGAGWLFLVTRHTEVSGKSGVAETRLVLGERTGKDDIFSRLPVANSLFHKKSLVVGCGAIGSFAGLELARAGVGEIGFLDYDTVEPGNSLRWPLGRPAWGRRKALALANFVSANYPWTTAYALDGRLGGAITDTAGLPRDLKGNVLTPLLDNVRKANVVIDASASFEVQHALAYYCREFKVPYVMGYATLGVAGGVVARFVPDSKSCLVCLHKHWNDDQHIPKPRVDDAGIVTPVGCNAPTFTGGGFDLQEISMEIVRSAVGLLSDGNYDSGNWPVAILTLKGEDGARVLPHWQACDCPPHPKCCGGGS